MAESIPSQEKFGTPSMDAGKPPDRICVIIQKIAPMPDPPIEPSTALGRNEIFHEDMPVGFDHDGAFRARVGVALSEALKNG